jgi:hypothetical protein
MTTMITCAVLQTDTAWAPTLRFTFYPEHKRLPAPPVKARRVSCLTKLDNHPTIAKTTATEMKLQIYLSISALAMCSTLVHCQEEVSICRRFSGSILNALSWQKQATDPRPLTLTRLSPMCYHFTYHLTIAGPYDASQISHTGKSRLAVDTSAGVLGQMPPQCCLYHQSRILLLYL